MPPATLKFQAAEAISPDQGEVLISTVTHVAPMFGDPGRYRAEYWTEGRLLAWVGVTVSVVLQPAPGPSPA
jgi:hypothetical protein